MEERLFSRSENFYKKQLRKEGGSMCKLHLKGKIGKQKLYIYEVTTKNLLFTESEKLF